MNGDLRTAFELEARIVKAYGLLIPECCTCRHKVITSYPDQPWYFVELCRTHIPRWRPEAKFGWFTGAGEPVATAQLAAAYLKSEAWSALLADRSVITEEGSSINYFGGVYYRLEDGELRYAEPG